MNFKRGERRGLARVSGGNHVECFWAQKITQCLIAEGIS